ncbi:MAG TPA: efflux RND transporter periplasmic adaptor subunit [Gemmatimonadaceae bacterium]|nr:efflux RND transporter periplasmic adaptor subunit [Gemmatimonadaceae bacterium]
MSKKLKWSILGIAVVGVGGLLALTAFKRDGNATEVRIEQVEARDLVASVTASGQVQPRTKVDLSSDITGKIVRLAVREGQMVSKGQFLLQIDPQQYEAALQRSQAALASAKAQEAQARANFLQAQRNYERSAQIKQANAQLVSQEQLETLKTQMEVQQALLEAARFSVEQSEAAVRDAQAALGKTTIVAPMSGRITRLNVENGETAIMGTLNKDAATLLTIADMSVLETNVKVDETDVSRISVGDSAVVEIDAFPDTTFVGRVVKISNSSVLAGAAGTAQGDQAVDYEVTIELADAPPDTRPDFSATAKIVTDIRRDVLSIPIIALTVRENEPVAQGDTATLTLAGRRGPTRELGKRDVEGVFIVGADNKVTFRPVEVGIAGEKYFEVLSGLQKGERIVGGTYQAIRELKDGTLVRETPVAGATDAKGPATTKGEK